MNLLPQGFVAGNKYKQSKKKNAGVVNDRQGLKKGGAVTWYPSCLVQKQASVDGVEPYDNLGTRKPHRLVQPVDATWRTRMAFTKKSSQMETPTFSMVSTKTLWKMS